MRKLRTIQIGIGHDHGTSGFNSLLKNDDLFECVGFAIPPEEEEQFADRVKEYRDDRGIPKYSIEEILELPDIDAAFIETVDYNLTKHAIMAAEKGLHIYMDKPGGTNLADFERLISIVKEKNLTFNVAYMYRFNPKVMETMDMIKRGDLGDVYCVEAHMDCEYGTYKRNWLGDYPGGMMFYLGCHLVDLVHMIMGEPQEVIPLNVATGYGGVTALDYGMACFKYPNGISFVKSCSNECGGYYRRQLVVCGTKATIEIKPFEMFEPGTERDYLYTVMREARLGEGWQSEGKITKTDYFNRFDAMVRCFGEVALGKREQPFTPDYELGTYKLLLKSCGVKID